MEIVVRPSRRGILFLHEYRQPFSDLRFGERLRLFGAYCGKDGGAFVGEFRRDFVLVRGGDGAWPRRIGENVEQTERERFNEFAAGIEGGVRLKWKH